MRFYEIVLFCDGLSGHIKAEAEFTWNGGSPNMAIRWGGGGYSVRQVKGYDREPIAPVTNPLPTRPWVSSYLKP